MKLIDIMQKILQLMFLKSSGTKQQTKKKNYKKNQTDFNNTMSTTTTWLSLYDCSILIKRKGTGILIECSL